MFYLGERTKSVEEGRRLAETMVAGGQAREKLRHGIRLQGGDPRVVDEPNRLPQSRFHVHVLSPPTGYVCGTNCEQFCIAPALFGAGPAKKAESSRHSLSLSMY